MSDRLENFIMKSLFFIFCIYFLLLTFQTTIAEEQTVSIPFGAFDPSFDTPVENWYEPPVISIQKGDTVSWINDDQEGHTVTSGEGPGRFGWMGSDKFGEPDGFFDSGRFMKGESWSFTFNEDGLFRYFYTFHPWMDGIVAVAELIPDYPHDSSGNKIEKFPVIEYTADGLIELDLTWEPNIIKTNEKVVFIYQTYDPTTSSSLDKMKYDIILIQNGDEIFRDDGMTSVGGDYRNFIFEFPGPIEIRFENIQSGGTSGIASAARAPAASPSLRTVTFTTIVYKNPDVTFTDEIVVQPARRFEIQYEILVAIILIPLGFAVAAILYMKYGNRKID